MQQHQQYTHFWQILLEVAKIADDWELLVFNWLIEILILSLEQQKTPFTTPHEYFNTAEKKHVSAPIQ